METYVVTGGAGFLGSHLCDFLLEHGHRVICMDNLITGTTDNIAHHAGNDRFKFVKHDVTTYLYVEGPVDCVLHFASPASPIDFERLPIQILKAGALGTHNALGLAKAKGAKFLLASTSEVYGDPQVHPQPEAYHGNVNPVGPRGMYDEAKRFAEAITMAYHRVHGVDTRIMRIFNTYGPRMRLDDGRVIPTFVTQALRGQPITIFGDGSHTRSFCYVADLIEGARRLLDAEFNDPVNVGSPDEISMLDLAGAVIRLAGSRSQVAFVRGEAMPQAAQDDPKVRRPDITRARNVLGWEPRVSLEEGLATTIEWFKSRLQA
jgi:dTDP-glucose 4,6-dehydratase